MNDGIMVYNPWPYLGMMVTGNDVTERLLELGLIPVYDNPENIERKELIARISKTCSIIIGDPIDFKVCCFVNDILAITNIIVLDKAKLMNSIKF